MMVLASPPLRLWSGLRQTGIGGHFLRMHTPSIPAVTYLTIVRMVSDHSPLLLFDFLGPARR